MEGPILAPVDGSDPASAALDYALEIAADENETVHVLYVANTNKPSLVRFGTNVADVLEAEGEEVVSEARSMADERGVPVVDRVLQGDPREVVVEYADEEDVGLVAMGAHGPRGIGEYLLGSTTEHVVNECVAPVVTVRAADDASHPYPYDDVLVPTDGSEHARAALNLASAVASRHDATLHLLFVVDELPETVDPGSVRLSEDVERNCNELLAEASTVASEAGVDDVVTAVETGSVPREVTAYAGAKEVDLVAMGTHGWSGIDRYLLGSFTERVVRTSPVPVLTTRESE